MSRTIHELLDEALLHFSFIDRYAQLDLEDSLVLDAIALRLSAAIDSLNRIPAEEKKELFGDTWILMYGMRNRIAHGYAMIDSEMVKATVQLELPEIVEKIRLYRNDDRTK